MNNVPNFPIEIAESIDSEMIAVTTTMTETVLGMPPHKQTEAQNSINTYFRSLRHWLTGRDHFFLDDPEPFLGLDFRGIDLSEARFPFPVTGLMFRYDPAAFDCDVDSLPKDRAPLDRDRFVMVADAEGSDRIMVLSFFKHDKATPHHIGTPGVWAMNPTAGIIYRERLIDAGDTMKPDEAIFQITPSIPEIPEGEFFETARERGIDRKEFANLIADDIRLAMGFLAISSAKNIPVETLPTPVKLNKKRAKRGRAPIPGYHVLDLSFGRKVEREGGESGRTHASPRLHTRRGHMRQCASGTITYVRPTLVGDPTKGAVSKDYRTRVKK